MRERSNIVLHLKDLKTILTDLRLEYTDYATSLGEEETCVEFSEWAENYIITNFLTDWSKGRTDKRQEQLDKQKIEEGKLAVKKLELPRSAIEEILATYIDDPE